MMNVIKNEHKPYFSGFCLVHLISNHRDALQSIMDLFGSRRTEIGTELQNIACMLPCLLQKCEVLDKNKTGADAETGGAFGITKNIEGLGV